MPNIEMQTKDQSGLLVCRILFGCSTYWGKHSSECHYH